jgi:hypothetical protein
MALKTILKLKLSRYLNNEEADVLKINLNNKQMVDKLNENIIAINIINNTKIINGEFDFMNDNVCFLFYTWFMNFVVQNTQTKLTFDNFKKMCNGEYVL